MVIKYHNNDYDQSMNETINETINQSFKDKILCALSCPAPRKTTVDDVLSRVIRRVVGGVAMAIK